MIQANRRTTLFQDRSCTMRKTVDHQDMAAAGYFADWSRTPGQDATFHLSSRDPGATARVVRLDRQHTQPTDWPIQRLGADLAAQTLDLGSWIEIDVAGSLTPDWSLNFALQLNGPTAGRVLASVDEHDWEAGMLPADALSPGRWLELRLAQAGQQQTLRLLAGAALLAEHRFTRPALAPRTLRIGRDAASRLPTLNATIAEIMLRDDCGGPITWELPIAGAARVLEPLQGGTARLVLHNEPTLAVRGPRWTGNVLDPRADPAQYGAVTLHDDDLADAAWPETHQFAIPRDAESGIYALEVSAGGETTRWPLFVTPQRRRADLVFLAPTFTYLAYANERLPPERFPWLCDDAGHRFARANRLTSLYDVHDDGSGVAFAGFRRPLATIRDDYRYPLCGAPHLLPVDLRLLRFLASEGIAVDVITDLELHQEGAAALAGYRGLVTGSHPEYWSGAMLDAAFAFRDEGGHIAYFGGNGCYWVTACNGRMIEVRRGLSGIRTWSSEPGETHLALTGEPGGLWRHRGRAEHRLLGVGLNAMGFSGARPFRRTEASYRAEWAWLFAGVGDAPIGSAGMVLGGAAGYEIDSRHARWGSAAHSVMLARADGFDPGYVIDPDAAEPDQTATIAAEMVMTEAESGALVFATGSVSWCGSLPDPGGSNAVGLITRNLLQRFIR
jgi:N,N-dimethylformamidase